MPVQAGGIDGVEKGKLDITSGTEDAPFTGPTWANDRRISNCAQARELYNRLYLENQLRAQSFAQIRNQIEGGRPLDPDDLFAIHILFLEHAELVAHFLVGVGQ